MGTDQPIKAIISLALSSEQPITKFAFCIAALALMAMIEAAQWNGDFGKQGEGDLSATYYFGSNLDSIQGALQDISKAGEDLGVLETKMEALVDGSAQIYAAETALETAVDSAAYINAFATPAVPV